MKPQVLFSSEAVFSQLPCMTKKQALKDLAAQAEPLTDIDAGEIFSVLMEREHAGVTAVGNGAAIPQARLPELKKICTLAATLKRPVEYGANDGKPVDILFLLLVPETGSADYLKAIATLTRISRNEPFCRAIRAAKTPEDLYDVLTHERA